MTQDVRVTTLDVLVMKRRRLLQTRAEPCMYSQRRSSHSCCC